MGALIAVIIACEQCNTRFRLDEARLPAKGARVRCSQCKHAFFVRRPGVDPQQALDEVVQEVAGGEDARTPEPAPDLDAIASRADNAPDAAADAAAVGEAGEQAEGLEADWEFNEEAPGGSAARAAPEAAAARAEPVDAGRPEPFPSEPDPLSEEDLEALGDPENWNLLADAPPLSHESESDGEAEEDAFEDFWAGPAAQGAGADDRERGRAAPEPARTDARAAEEAPRPRRGLPALGGVVAGASWALTLALAGFALATLGIQALRPLPEVSPEATPLRLAEGRVDELEAQWLENAHVGPLLVISGRFVPTPRPVAPAAAGLELQLLARDGRALEGARAWAGPPRSERALRELSPDALRQQLAADTAALLEPGGGRFQAVFAGIAQEAADLSLRVRPPPSTSRPIPPRPSSG